MVFTIHGEIIPEYLAAIQPGQFVLDRRNINTLGQNSTTPKSHYILMTFIPKTSNRVIRRKRDWLIPPVSVSENDRGPFPQEVVKMKSTAAESMKMIYKITGPGADEPPIGLFKVDKFTGWLRVTKSLDREETAEYILTTHASTEDQSYIETPVKIIIKVIDQNDNKPLCTQNPFMGEVQERAKQNVPVIQVTAKDIDDPETGNAIVRYKLVSQKPNGGVFHIDPASGVISLATMGILDRETQNEYDLAVEAADMDGHGLSSTCTVVIKITDSNDHAPKFRQKMYAGTVQENKAGEIVARFDVTDSDEPSTANSVAKFTIIQGNEKGFFNISTGPSGMEGIITTSKGLDFEQDNSFSLVVVVENEVPFAIPLVTSTATVTITVQDVNEPPVFEPAKKQIMINEDIEVGSTISKYTANDPDTAREQQIRYKLLQDFANWLEITEDTGLIRVKSSLDREALFIRNEQYTVLVMAYDNDDEPATGTGTLVIKLMDVNDNAPVLEQRSVSMCLTEPKPIRLTVTDPDGPENGPPFTVKLLTENHKEFHSNWTIISNSSSNVVWLKPLISLALGKYNVAMRIYDSKSVFQDSSIIVEVCDCKGGDVTCSSGIYGAVAGVTLTVYVLVAILCFLVLLLLLLLLKRRCGRKVQWEQFKVTQEDRDNILCYNEEGGGEQDQEFDMVLLCRPEVFSTDIAPMASPTAFFRQHPYENEDIENFIYENLHTANNDHYVAPYDSVLVFAHEGEGSVAESLSSLQSSISNEDQDFQHLQNWGPQFRRLADMCAGDE
ncbi:Cadherin-1 [Labeo rohita]|uniref:Cadherin-1 n=2 Tax=Labeo rohita TaxID=84645 RepID=A0ABQ8LRX2_LABRO|nr:Cadherin-1 [Labeo rohita]